MQPLKPPSSSNVGCPSPQSFEPSLCGSSTQCGGGGAAREADCEPGMRPKGHVLAATALLFLLALACRRRVTTTADAMTASTVAEPTTTSSPEADKARLTKKIATVDTIAAIKLPP